MNPTTTMKFRRESWELPSFLVGAKGLVELPESLTRLEPGSMVDFPSFNEVGR